MIVVTGGTGHIGNVLVRKLLEKGEDVRVIIPPMEEDIALRDLSVDIVRADICNLPSLCEAFKGATSLYHLAGIVSIMPGMKELMQRVNVVGTRNVVEACLQTGVRRMIYTSSVHAFAELPFGYIITENSEISPDKVIGDYARSKALATHEVWAGVKKGLDAVIVHPSGVIGPYEYKVSNTGQLINQFIKGHLLFYINGGYDFVDVRDVAEGLMQVCEKGRTGENYILSGQWVSIGEILGLLKKITQRDTPCVMVPFWVAKMLAPFTTLYAYLRKTSPLLTSYSLYTLRSNSLFSHNKALLEWGYSPRPLTETLVDTVQWLSSSKTSLE